MWQRCALPLCVSGEPSLFFFLFFFFFLWVFFGFCVALDAVISDEAFCLWLGQEAPAMVPSFVDLSQKYQEQCRPLLSCYAAEHSQYCALPTPLTRRPSSIKWQHAPRYFRSLQDVRGRKWKPNVIGRNCGEMAIGKSSPKNAQVEMRAFLEMAVRVARHRRACGIWVLLLVTTCDSR